MSKKPKKTKQWNPKAVAISFASFGAGIAGGVLTNVLRGTQWILPISIFLTVIIGILVSSRGPLNRQVHGGLSWIRWLATLVLVGYPFICWLVIEKFGQGFWPTFLSIAFFTLAVALLSWQSFRRVVTAPEIGLGLALILVGVAVILWAVSFWQDGNTLSGVAMLLGGVAVIPGAVSFWQGGDTLFGIALLLGGVAVILIGISFWQDGNTLLGIALLLIGVAVILGAVSFWQGGDTLTGVALLLGGVAVILIGISFWQDGNTLLGIAMLLGGVTAIPGAVSFWQGVNTLLGIALLLFGVAFILIGVFFWQAGYTLLGIATLLFGMVIVAYIFIIFLRNDNGSTLWRDKVVAFFSKRDEPLE